jgi:hypothetical protein
LIGYGQARGFVSKSGSPEAQADNLLSMWEGLQVVRSRLSLSERTAADPAAPLQEGPVRPGRTRPVRSAAAPPPKPASSFP